MARFLAWDNGFPDYSELPSPQLFEGLAAYKAISLQIRDIFAEYTPIIEPLSLDEAPRGRAGRSSLGGVAALCACAF